MISGLCGPHGEPSQSPYQVTSGQPGFPEERGDLGLVQEAERVRDHHGLPVQARLTLRAGAGVRAGEAEPGLVGDQVTGHRADVIVHVGHQAGRFHPLPGVLRVPVLPLPHGRVPGLERDPAPRGQLPGQGPQRRPDVVVGQQQLEHVPGHDDQVETGPGGQARGVGLDPAHPVTAGTGPGDIQHRRRRVGTGHLVPAGGELAGEAPRAAAHVQDPGRRRAGQAEVEPRAVPGRVQRVVQGGQPRISVAGAGLDSTRVNSAGMAGTGHGPQTKARLPGLMRPVALAGQAAPAGCGRGPA